MLNPFPIQFLALLAYFVLRLFVGAILIYLGVRHARSIPELSKILAFKWYPYGTLAAWKLVVVELITGTMFVFGVSTQIAALITMVLVLKLLVLKHLRKSPHFESFTFYLLLLGCALALFVTGAGALAFDLPL